jgi:cell filamentation protein
VTFDPFGDLDGRGYLQNVAGSNEPAVIKRLERDAFRSNVEAAVAALRARPRLVYGDVLDTHRRLFADVYPTWAGKDRAETAPHLAIAKGGRLDLFAHPAVIGRAVDHALQQGQDPVVMRREPGSVFGTLAHAHPFLDGNGRTILVVHGELARRAGFHIEWSAVPQNQFLMALTAELDWPGSSLDPFLKPFIRPEPLGSGGEAAALRAFQASSGPGRTDETV